MYIIATFEQNMYLELALTALRQKGLAKEKILAVPLDKRTEPAKLFDSLHYSDGFSMLDLGAILGTCLMLLGAVYGYVLKWGPILWGVIGGASGLAIGLIIKLAIIRKKHSLAQQNLAEVVVMIHCEEEKCDAFEQLLWENMALGVAYIRHIK